MYKVCKSEQSRKRQRYIESVFVKMLQEEEFSQIKINALCELCDIPRKAFYRYYDTKEDLLMAVVDHAIEDFTNQFNVGKYDNGITVELLEAFYIYWQENADFVSALERSACSSMLLERNIYLLMRVRENDFSERSFLKYLFSLSGIYATLIIWLKVGGKTPHEMAVYTYETLNSPLTEA